MKDKSMRYKVQLLLLATLGAFSLSACTLQSANDRVINQATLGINWMQQSGEYDAITLQTYHTATLAFDQAHSAHGTKKAVVVDLDETVLDNSAYAGWQIKHKQPFTNDSWIRWMNAEQATEIPGSKAFINYVNSHGGAVFFVTNRDQSTGLASTIDNMRALGYSGLQEDRFYLKTDTSNKQARFDAIKSRGYDIVLYIGDNLNDFGAATYHQNSQARKDFVEKNQALFGKKYFVLPNPNYGGWRSAMAKDYWQLNAEEMLKVNNEALKVWNGD